MTASLHPTADSRANSPDKEQLTPSSSVGAMPDCDALEQVLAAAPLAAASALHARSGSSCSGDGRLPDMGRVPAAAGAAAAGAWHRRCLSAGNWLGSAGSLVPAGQQQQQHAQGQAQLQAVAACASLPLCRPARSRSQADLQAARGSAPPQHRSNGSNGRRSSSSRTPPEEPPGSQRSSDGRQLDHATLLAQVQMQHQALAAASGAAVQAQQNGLSGLRPGNGLARGGSGSYSAPVSKVASPVVSPVRGGPAPGAGGGATPAPISLGRPAALPLAAGEGVDDAPDLERFLQAVTPLVVPPTEGLAQLRMVSLPCGPNPAAEKQGWQPPAPM